MIYAISTVRQVSIYDIISWESMSLKKSKETFSLSVGLMFADVLDIIPNDDVSDVTYRLDVYLLP